MAEAKPYEINLTKCVFKAGQFVTPWKDFHLLNLKQLVKIGFDYVAGSDKDSKPTNLEVVVLKQKLSSHTHAFFPICF